MKPEKTTRVRRDLNDAERDNVLKLLGCGLSQHEIANMLHISRSCVGNINQAHTACLAEDWSILQKLSTKTMSTVNWAMKVTGKDKVFDEIFPKEPEPSVTGPTVDDTPSPTPAIPDYITREDFASLNNTLQDICYLLTEIRDMLK